MQRFLRGRALYLLLGTLVVLLYLHASPAPLSDSPRLSPPSERHEPLVWWPEQLNQTTLQRIAAQHPSVVMTLSVLLVFVVGMFVGGLSLLLWAVWTRQLQGVWRFAGRPLPRWSFGELGRIVGLTALMASLLPFVRLAIHAAQPNWEVDTHLWLTGSMLFLDLFVILAILTFSVSKGPSVWKVFGFSGRRLSESIEVGFRGYLAVFPWLFILLMVIVEIARAFHLQPPLEPIHELIFGERRPFVLGLTVLLACLVGPLAEEFFFRGILYPAIRQRTSRVAALLINGAVFSLIHTNPVGFLPIMVLGCLLAYLYERTGSLLSPLAIHILHNVFLMTLALLFRQFTALG